jgi:hypothetical protein
MKKAFRPLDSPYLASSDFFLLVHVNQILAGQEFSDGEAFVEAPYHDFGRQ